MIKLRFMAAVTAVLLTGAGTVAFAQDRLVTSSTKPLVNGVVKTGEYTYMHDFDQQLALYASRTRDVLYVGVVGKTSGWVAFGLGSQRMDGAAIFMGFVGADGKVSFKPQLGRGHRHSDAPADINDTVISYAMKEAGGQTTLEVAVKADAFIKKGQSALDVIYAMGDQKSFSPYHSYRGATSLPLE